MGTISAFLSMLLLSCELVELVLRCCMTVWTHHAFSCIGLVIFLEPVELTNWIYHWTYKPFHHTQFKKHFQAVLRHLFLELLDCHVVHPCGFVDFWKGSLSSYVMGLVRRRVHAVCTLYKLIRRIVTLIVWNKMFTLLLLEI